jgi:hypothetical protein
MLTGVNTHEIISALDDEIARLQHARTLIAGLTTQKQIGRPLALASPKKRVISDEGRKRMADAQRKRWAARKKKPAKAE